MSHIFVFHFIRAHVLNLIYPCAIDDGYLKDPREWQGFALKQAPGAKDFPLTWKSEARASAFECVVARFQSCTSFVAW